MRRILVHGALTLIGLLLAGGGVAATLLVRSAAGGETGGERVLPSLSAPASVTFDSLGIPHVRAATIADAFRVQGFLHARDRLWQMELLRRVAEGRLSEILGERALPSDRFLRTLGLGRAARAGITALDAEALTLLEAYATGVNDAIEGWEGALPPEFLLLRVRPAPWTVEHVVAIEKIMAWDLADYSETLALARARPRLEEAEWAAIRPGYPLDGLTILEHAPPASGGWNGESGSARSVPADGIVADPRLFDAAAVPELAAALLEAGGAVRASNSWVLGGGRTRSGLPILANDMHLQLNVPTLWYLVSLQAPGLEVSGMSLPGSPGVVAGRTRGVAWGFTNASLDDADLFIERLDPSDSTRYLVPGGSEPFELLREEIRVRGRAEPEVVDVRITRHGPVVSDVEAVPGGELLALRWAGHDPAPTASALIAMNRANTAADFLTALRGFRNPNQNVVFADTAGTFGYQMVGRIPRRGAGNPPPHLPVPGWTGEHDWEGYLPFELNPSELNPERGYIVTANHRQGWDSVSVLISGGGWAEPFRGERITAGVLATSLHDVESTRRLQGDVVDGQGLRFRELAAAAFEATGDPDVARLLRDWDGEMGLDRIEPTLLFTWLEVFRERVRSWVYGGAGGGFLPRPALARLLADVGAAEFRDEAIAAAAAVRQHFGSEIPTWGRAHTLTLAHPLASLPVLGAVAGFPSVETPVPGGPTTVNVSDFGGGGGFPPFRVTHGASQRHVSDLGDPDGTGWFILPGGQSGLPRSPHAMDQLGAWLRGELHPLRAGGAEAGPSLHLVPGGGR